MTVYVRKENLVSMLPNIAGKEKSRNEAVEMHTKRNKIEYRSFLHWSAKNATYMLLQVRKARKKLKKLTLQCSIIICADLSRLSSSPLSESGISCLLDSAYKHINKSVYKLLLNCSLTL